MCSPRMSVITPPTTYVYGTLFIISAIVAAGENTLALIVLWHPRLKSKSNKILTSLAISDMLVGYVMFPMNTWQILSGTALQDCNVDIVRGSINVFLVGSSCTTLGIIAYERYILLTKLNNHKKFLTKRKTALLLVIAWVVPALIPTLRFVGKYPYSIGVIFINTAPLFVLSISYAFIAKAIYKKEKALRSHQQQKDIQTRNVLNSTNTENNKGKRIQHRQLKLAKAVAILIICYLCCIIPTHLWIILYLINTRSFIEPIIIQNVYLVAIFTASFNSCINPAIYMLKYPEMRRGLRKLFGTTPKISVRNLACDRK